MTDAPEQPPAEPQIVDEAAFCRQLGLNPDHVMTGSINVEFTPQGAVVGWVSKVIVPPRVVGLAFIAGSGLTVTETPPEPKQPQDRRPAKKAAATPRKRAAKKA